MSFQGWIAHSFLELSTVLLSGCSTVYLSSNLLKDILVASIFWQLGIKFLKTPMCRFLWEHKFSNLLGKYQGIQLLDCIIRVRYKLRCTFLHVITQLFHSIHSSLNHLSIFLKTNESYLFVWSIFVLLLLGSWLIRVFYALAQCDINPPNVLGLFWSYFAYSSFFTFHINLALALQFLQ